MRYGIQIKALCRAKENSLDAEIPIYVT